MRRLLLCAAINGLAFSASMGVEFAPDLQALIKESDEVVIFEGLPHPLFEAELRDKVAKKRTINISDELFYSSSIEVPIDDRAALNELVGTYSAFVRWTGMKLCGGFHADYAIEWRKGSDRTMAVLICFSCHEALLVCVEGQRTFDLSDHGLKILKPLLAKYRRNRPASPSPERQSMLEPEPITSEPIKIEPIKTDPLVTEPPRDVMPRAGG